MSDDEQPLVVRGRSPQRLRDGRFTIAVASGLFILQLLVSAVGWTDSPLVVSFGLLAAAVFLIGLFIIFVGTRAACCGVCGAGLHPDRYLALSARADAAVADAVARGDARAIVDLVAAQPRRPPEDWTRLWVQSCPSGHVALVRVEQTRAFAGKRPSHVFSGTDVDDLLEVSEVDLG